MEEEELESLGLCLDCGEPVDTEIGRVFTFGERGVLCWTCAARRGGEHDDVHDRWITAPNVTDLLEGHLTDG
jgi:hypothetical protein